MKKYYIYLWVVLLILLFIIFVWKNKYYLYIADKNIHNLLYTEENKSYIDKIQLKNNYFISSYYNKTNICSNWRLFLLKEWWKNYEEIFSYHNFNEDIKPCIYKIDLLNNHEFNMEFCLSDGWWSWECLGMNMIYNIENNTWNEWQLKWININDKSKSENIVEAMNKYELSKYNYFINWF